MYISYFVILNQILICSIGFCRNVVALTYYVKPHHEICKHFSILTCLFKNGNQKHFKTSSPPLTGFLKETESVFERILSLKGNLLLKL